MSTTDDNRLLISDVAKLLEGSTSKNIKHHGKNTTLYFYIVHAWGGIEQFIDTVDGYSLFIKDDKKYILITDEEAIYLECPLNTFGGWELVDIPKISILRSC